MIDGIRKILECAVWVFLLAVLAQGYLLFSEARETLRMAKEHALLLSHESTAALGAWREYSNSLKAQLEDKEVQRSIGLFLRSGDDLGRTIKKANVTLDVLQNAIRDTSDHFNGRLVPTVLVALDRASGDLRKTLDNTDRVLESTADAVNQLSMQGNSLTREVNENLSVSKRAIEALEARANSPEVDATMYHVAKAAESSAATARRVEKLTRPLAWIGSGVRRIGAGVKHIFGRRKNAKSL